MLLILPVHFPQWQGVYCEDYTYTNLYCSFQETSEKIIKENAEKYSIKAENNNQTSLNSSFSQTHTSHKLYDHISVCRVCRLTNSTLHNSLVRPQQGVVLPAVVRASLESRCDCQCSYKWGKETAGGRTEETKILSRHHHILYCGAWQCSMQIDGISLKCPWMIRCLMWWRVEKLMVNSKSSVWYRVLNPYQH